MTLFEYLGEGNPLRKLYETRLLNKELPRIAMISRDGRFFVTIDEFGSYGISPVTIVVYDLARREHTAYAGKDFLDSKVIESLPSHGSWGFKWYGKDMVFNRDSTQFYPTRPEHCEEEGVPFVVVDLPTRTVRVQPVSSVDTESIVARVDQEWGWKPSRETVHTMTTVLPRQMTWSSPGLPDRVLELSRDETAYLPRQKAGTTRDEKSRRRPQDALQD
ncbi:MAG: hypothetical protein RIC55_17880 [Pirellulaceae bacterium]